MYNIAVVVDIAAVVVVVVVVVIVAHDGQITDPHLVIQIFEGKYIPGLYFLAHAAGWQSYNNLYDLAHVSWVGYVLYKPCTASHIGRLG